MDLFLEDSPKALLHKQQFSDWCASHRGRNTTTEAKGNENAVPAVAIQSLWKHTGGQAAQMTGSIHCFILSSSPESPEDH